MPVSNDAGIVCISGKKVLPLPKISKKMKIRSAEFEISNSDVTKCPDSTLPEYAFIGRSNVGKSSLINMLTERKGLAKTSQTPGKTLLINHFRINDEWYIVDLPGYGYARRGKDQRQQLERIIRGYIMARQQMSCLFVLVDSRLKPQKIDTDFMQWLGESGVPFAIVFTKLDKLGKQAAAESIAAYKRELLKTWEELPPIFLTSSEDGRGRNELLDYIATINAQLAQQ
jgi:GTP-binding protein